MKRLDHMVNISKDANDAPAEPKRKCEAQSDNKPDKSRVTIHPASYAHYTIYGNEKSIRGLSV